MHRWIGANFATRRRFGDLEVVITAPDDFCDELYALPENFARRRGTALLQEVDRLLGKAGRLGFLMPTCMPFVGALRGGLTGSLQARAAGHREAPPGMVAVA